MLEEYSTKEQCSVVHILWVKGLNRKDIHKEIFLFPVGSVHHIKQSTTRSRNSLKDIQKLQIMPDQVAMWRF
jgi:hypothetical protein